MTMRLAFTPYSFPAVRASHALDQVDYTESRFWQRVDYLLALPAAEQAYPTQVRRLRRLRAARQHQRSTRRLLDA